MTKSISIIIASYGDAKWKSLAETRAYPSAKRQFNSEIIMVHDPSATNPAEVRNKGAAQAHGSYLIFLDADDKLEDGYTVEMMRSECASGGNKILYPKVRRIKNPEEEITPPEAQILPKTRLDRGNFMVVSSMIPRHMFFRADQFRPIEGYEDYDLWQRMWILGCEPTLAPGAVLRVYQSLNGRNLSIKNPGLLCREILEYNKNWREQWIHSVC